MAPDADKEPPRSSSERKPTGNASSFETFGSSVPQDGVATSRAPRSLPQDIVGGNRDDGGHPAAAQSPTGSANAPQENKPTIGAAWNTVKKEDFLEVHKMPCARQGLLTGIGSGFAAGCLRFVIGGKLGKAANWAVGSFVLGSIVQWEICQNQRLRERAQVARAVEIMSRKQAEKQQQAEDARKKREQEAAAKSSWYKFWS